jgi:thiamine phosphate synthase YjbQ (UPF0047 family)
LRLFLKNGFLARCFERMALFRVAGNRGEGPERRRGRKGRASSVRRGIVTVFCRHTSASLVVMENADPPARRDLEDWLDQLVPEGDRHFTHTLEGADDMPGHIRMALTRSSETVAVSDGAPARTK